MPDPTYPDIAPTISAAVPVEADAAAMIASPTVGAVPPVPTLTKAVVLEVIRYGRWLGVTIGAPKAEITNGPRHIVQIVCGKLGANAVTEAQVVQLIQEWRAYVGWKASQTAGGNGEVVG